MHLRPITLDYVCHDTRRLTSLVTKRGRLTSLWTCNWLGPKAPSMADLDTDAVMMVVI